MAKRTKFDLDQLISTFGLTLQQEGALIAHWFSKDAPAQVESDAASLSLLERQRQRLVTQGAGWNEEELKMRFLAFVLEYIDFDVSGKVRVFFERPLSATIGSEELSVKCDCLFAKPYGINSPEKPYFFLQEFKRQKQTEDAEAQMLTAMLIAEQENADKKPVYGAFLQGKNWTFAALQDKTYAVSRQFDATQKDDFDQIIGVMQRLKQMILER